MSKVDRAQQLQIAKEHHQAGRLVQAEAMYRQLILDESENDDPASGSYFYSLGNILLAQGRQEEAAASYRQAIKIKPDCVEAYSNLGHMHQVQGRLEEAVEFFRQALSIKPDFFIAQSNLIVTLDLSSNIDTSCLQAERRRWAEVFADALHVPSTFPNMADPDRRLRIGYVSADFRAHSAAIGFGAMLVKFDTTVFDTFAYSNSKIEDECTHLFQNSVTHWRKVFDLSDDAVADLIRQDQIDILVDLSGHSAGNRLLVFARKPAPIQITAWGYAGGTGMKAMDVLFTDPVIIPPEEKSFFTEEVRYLPCVITAFIPGGYPEVNDSHAKFALEEKWAPPGLFHLFGKVIAEAFKGWFLPLRSRSSPMSVSATRNVTFGSFNRLSKISPEVVKLWSDVLSTIPGSRMVLKASELDDAGAREHILGQFNRAGVAAERLTLLGGTSGHDHRAAFNQIDISLDTFPQCGGATTLDGLMMGVPSITLRGNTFVGRGSASLLTAVGLSDWIAETPAQYVEIAVRKARDQRALAELRQQLRPRFMASIIGDTESYVRIVEQEYRKLWREWCFRSGASRHREADEAGLEVQLQRAREHHQAGRLLQAGEIYREILREVPRHADALNLLGVIAIQQGDYPAAFDFFSQAINIAPDRENYHFSLGNSLLALDRLDEAAASYRQTLLLKPNIAEAYNNLGFVLQAQGRSDEALDCFRKALSIKPDYVDAQNNLIFALDLSPDADSAMLQAERRRLGESCAATIPAPLPHDNLPDPERRLRIGYVSADFNQHSAAVCFGAMLTRFDPAEFDVFAYSNSTKEDGHTRLFQDSVTGWRSIVGLSDTAVADLIRQDGIDILVDLSGYSAGNRLPVFARKPAPLQITAWGYAGGTGMKAMDVMFTDTVIVPPEEKKHYAEKIIYLPCVASGFFPAPFPLINPLPAVVANRVTLGSFNRLAKLSAETFATWARVLLAIPASNMVLKTAELDDAGTRDRILGNFIQAGVDPACIVLLGSTNWADHMAAFNLIDISLDPFPQSGGVTTQEGLMMGVPVVTLRGHTFVGRGSASILTTLGLTDWIAETPEQYVRIAVEKAQDLTALAELRQQLRPRFMSSIIGDTTAYAKVVEQEYRKLWREWCSQSGNRQEASP